VQIGCEPLKTIVVKPLELSAPILTPEPETLRDARVLQENCLLPGKLVKWRFHNSYLDSSSLQSSPKGN
jgi:hypothetical protein